MSNLVVIIALSSLLTFFSSALNIPYQGSLEYKGKHVCGVTITSLSAFLTAANCVQDKTSKNLTVRAGTISRGEGGKLVEIQEIKIHPNYDNKTLDYDLAILIPKEPFPAHGLVTEYIATVPIAQGSDTYEGKTGITSGWGYDDLDGGLTETLMFVDLPILSKSECVAKHENLTDRMICAGNLKGGQGTCDGDAGGPLTIDNVLVGITSAFSCGRQNEPDIFTDVRVLKSWIDSNTPKSN